MCMYIDTCVYRYKPHAEVDNPVLFLSYLAFAMRLPHLDTPGKSRAVNIGIYW